MTVEKIVYVISDFNIIDDGYHSDCQWSYYRSSIGIVPTYAHTIATRSGNGIKLIVAIDTRMEKEPRSELFARWVDGIAELEGVTYD